MHHKVDCLQCMDLTSLNINARLHVDLESEVCPFALLVFVYSAMEKEFPPHTIQIIKKC